MPNREGKFTTGITSKKGHIKVTVSYNNIYND